MRRGPSFLSLSFTVDAVCLLFFGQSILVVEGRFLGLHVDGGAFCALLFVGQSNHVDRGAFGRLLFFDQSSMTSH